MQRDFGLPCFRDGFRKFADVTCEASDMTTDNSYSSTRKGHSTNACTLRPARHYFMNVHLVQWESVIQLPNDTKVAQIHQFMTGSS